MNNVFAPFLNTTIFRLMNWFYSSATKSIADLQALVDDVFLSPDFNLTDLKQFSAKQELRHMDGEIHTMESTSSPFSNENGWQQSTIRIKLPVKKVHQREDDASELKIPGVYHCSFLVVVRATVIWQNVGGAEWNVVLAGDPKSLVYYIISKLKQEAHLAGDPKRKG